MNWLETSSDLILNLWVLINNKLAQKLEQDLSPRYSTVFSSQATQAKNYSKSGQNYEKTKRIKIKIETERTFEIYISIQAKN